MINIEPITLSFEEKQGVKFSANILTYNTESSIGNTYWQIFDENGIELKSKNTPLDELEFDALKKGTLDVEDLLIQKLGLVRLPTDPLTEEEELALKALLYEKKIIATYTELMARSLSFSMDKSGKLSYLNLQKQEYQEKYDLAKLYFADNNSVELDEKLKISMEHEMVNDFPEELLDSTLSDYGVTPTGTPFNKMCQLVIFRYEYGLVKYKAFNAFAVFYRAKSRTMIERSEFDKIDEGTNLALTACANIN